MKKFVIAAVAAVLIGSPMAASAQPFRGDTVRTIVVEKRNGTIVGTTTVRPDRLSRAERRRARGQRFDARYPRDHSVIHDPRAYRFYEAPRNHRWVQSGKDAVLIGITSGIVGAVIVDPRPGIAIQSRSGAASGKYERYFLPSYAALANEERGSNRVR